MRILAITDQAIGPSHGTGALLMRYFSGIPSVTLFNACLSMSAEADLSKTTVVPDQSRRVRTSLGHLRRLQFTDAVRSLSKTAYARLLAKVQAFEPELIWIIVCTPRGIRVAGQLVELFPKTPCYCSFWDLLQIDQLDKPSNHKDLLYLSHRAMLFDAISEPLAEELTRRIARPVAVENFFCTESLSHPAKDQRWSSGQGRLVMVGNVWLKEALECLQQIVHQTRKLRPQTQDVLWYCHRDSLRRLGISEHKMPPGFAYGGPGIELGSKIGPGDLCLVPIHGPKTYNEGYSRFSIPSKVTELFASGVPVFSIGGPTTAFASYLAHTQAGVTVDPEPITSAAVALTELLDNSVKRGQMSENAQAYAREFFQIDGFRERLLDRLRSVHNSGG